MVNLHKAVSEINLEAATGVQVTDAGTREGQDDQQAGKDFVLPADTRATCLQLLLSP